MASLFKKNAYYVLGLSIEASQKEIKKRADSIQRHLEVGDKPEFETDFSFLEATRTKNSVKEAFQKLTAPSKRIREYFFWFDINDSLDKKALELAIDNKLKDAKEIWLDKGKEGSVVELVARKNLAILICLSLIEDGSQQKLTSSVRLWEEIIRSDKFWKHFSREYELNDETGVNLSAIEEFRIDVISELSDFYTELSRQHKDNSYYSEFSKKFKVKGQLIEQEVLAPIYEAINDASEDLRKLNISDDQIFSEEEAKELKRLTDTLDSKFKELNELGLYEESRSKTMRDKAAEGICTVAIDLYNNMNESTMPVSLLKIAVGIAGTTSLVNKLKGDIAQIQQNTSNEADIIPLNKLIDQEKYEEALEKSIDFTHKYSKNKELLSFFQSRIRLCVTAIAMRDIEVAKANFENKNEKLASQQLLEIIAYINKNLEYFNYKQETVERFIEDINSHVEGLDINNASQIDEYRSNTIKKLKENFGEEQFEGPLMIVLMDCYIYGAFAKIIPDLRSKKHTKSIIGWAVAIGIFILFSIIRGAFGSSSSNSATSSSNSAYISCTSELNSLKSQKDSIESQMNSYQSAGNNKAYNQLVPQQNLLVTQYNAKIDTCNSLG